MVKGFSESEVKNDNLIENLRKRKKDWLLFLKEENLLILCQERSR